MPTVRRRILEIWRREALQGVRLSQRREWFATQADHGTVDDQSEPEMGQ